jgi:lysophospholipase L1-like esterase
MTIVMDYKKYIEKNSKKFFLLFYLIFLAFLLLTDVVIKKIYNYLEEKKTYVEKNSIYHHDLKKNYIFKDIFGNKPIIYTNLLGFKDIKIREIQNKINERRIVFIGDSFTEGVGLKFEQTFVGIIYKFAKKNNIEVLNAGVQAYSPIIYWRKVKWLIEEKKFKFDELVVYVDISDIQDEAQYYTLDNKENIISRGLQEKFIEDRNLRALFINIMDKYTFFTFRIIQFLKNPHYYTAKPQDLNFNSWTIIIADGPNNKGNWTIKDLSYSKKGVALSTKYMDKLFRLCKNNNIKMTIAVYPWPNQVWYEDLDSKQVQIWKNFSEERGIKFINNFPDFVKKKISDNDKLDIIKKYYFPADVHFNEYGSKVIANNFINSYFK